MTAALVDVLFWLCATGVAYTYGGYPLLAWALASAFGRDRENPSRVPVAASDPQRPTFVSVLIAAHNEEEVIADRIANTLALDYPTDRIEIVVASDGSTDRTVEIARQVRDPRLRVLDFTRRRGKAAVLNEVIPSLTGDVVLLSDANTSMEPTVVRRVARWFDDDAIGVVVGRLVLTDPATGKNVDSLYWRYETFLKTMDARLNALLGANGAIYALRRRLFTPLPDGTLVDDFVLPLLIRLHTACEIVYDRAILAHEETPAQIRSEFRRRSRIGAGGFQSLSVLWPLLSPARGWIAFTFFSHKVLRWVCPFFLLGALAANALLLDQSPYRVVLTAQACFYAAAAIGGFIPGSGRAVRLIRLVTLFTSMNLALLTGFCRWAAGVRGGVWMRTARTLTTRPTAWVHTAAALDSDRPIRVVHLVIALEIGGLEMVVASLAKQHSRRCQLHVMCLEGLGPIAARFEHAGVPVECIGSPTMSVAQSVIRLRRRLTMLQPDVIHTHNEKAHIRGMLATLGWWHRPALVHTRHGRSQVVGWPARLANRLALWRSRFLVSVSADASAILREEGTEPERIRVIRNGIDVAAHDARAWRDRAQKRAIAVARLTPIKDFQTLLRAARLVANVHLDFHLDIVGDGPSRGELLALRRDLRLERHVTLHGAADDVPRFLSAATLFVQSSISEGISLTLLEAMAAALPVVATRVGGTAEVVEHGVTGMLVAPGDPLGLAAAMLRVFRDRVLAASMSHAARVRVEQSFSLQQMTASYESLYEQALARPGLQVASVYRAAL